MEGTIHIEYTITQISILYTFGLCVKEAIDSINLKISITKGNDVFSTIFVVPLQTKFTLNMSAYECAPMLRFWCVSKLETNFSLT